MDSNETEKENMQDSTEGNVRPQRDINLTEKGQEHFENLRESYLARIAGTWGSLDDRLNCIDGAQDNVEELLNLHAEIQKIGTELETQGSDYLQFLNRHRADIELDRFTRTLKGYRLLVDTSMRKLSLRVEDLKFKENASRSSNKTISSYSQSHSSAAVRKRAKAEALKASLKYAEDQALLQKRQAELKLRHAVADKENAELTAEMNLLNIKREALELDVEAQVLENGEAQVVEKEGSSFKSVIENLTTENAQKRTSDYVQRISSTCASETPQVTAPQNPNIEFVTSHPHMSASQLTSVSQSQTYGVPLVPTSQNQNIELLTPHPQISGELQTSVSQSQTYGVPLVSTSQNQIYGTPSVSRSQQIPTEITKFLLKKDLLLSRLTTFNDKPEFYLTWKNTFKAIMQELEATPSEEIDLLIKWTGPTSQRHIISIKAANASNPEHALRRSWNRLDERFGCPEMVESALKAKLDSFQTLTNKDLHRLYDLSDILDEIEAIKEDSRYSCLLSYFDSSSGVTPIVKKLPTFIQGKWTNDAVAYMSTNEVPFPPFKVFARFIREQAKIRNNPSFAYVKADIPRKKPEKVSTHKTDCMQLSDVSVRKCPLHGTYHSLNKCRTFKKKSLDERREFLKDNDICFKCCDSNSHKRRDCTAQVKCSDCGSTDHPSALHITVHDKRNHGGEKPNYGRPNGGEKPNYGRPYGGETQYNNGRNGRDVRDTTDSIGSMCTQICGGQFSGKSCSKTLLVKVFPKKDPRQAIPMYAVIDDQSNRSLVSPKFFDLFNVQADSTVYTLSSCGGTITTTGRKASGFMVESFDGSCTLDLPTLIECENVPNVREEIPTPDVAQHYSHLRDISSLIPSLEPKAEILMLLGRDIVEAHHVVDQRIGGRNQPYGQKLRLGWTIIGETCLHKTHVPTSIKTYKTYLLGSGRASLMPPCTNEFKIREDINHVSYGVNSTDTSSHRSDDFGKDVFQRTKDDEKLGMSADDKQFLDIMDDGFERDANNNWIAPLPFRKPRSRLPNNRSVALRRAKSLEASLKRDPLKLEHFLTFMEGILTNGHAELAPQLAQDEECWFLPIFGVYHPKKPDQVRGVFDSSAKHEGLSLNDVLLSGPDLTNSLLGVLMRFRREPVAVMADVQQMFYCFKVKENHRNFLRFFWFKDNNPNNPMVEYRMTVHVFGNRPSPAVATYGIRRTALIAESEFGQDVRDFVMNNFYVDDGLLSLPTASEATSLIKRTQKALLVEGNVRLHKISSNSNEVLSSFPPEDLAKDIKDLEFGKDLLPSQRSLGLNWNLDDDSFFFEVTSKNTTCSRRGILSCVNSIFDPLGFLAPVVIEGKNILRTLVQSTIDWDTPLSSDQIEIWEHWRDSLVHLGNLKIPRTYAQLSLENCAHRSVHIFCDASEMAIAAVGYIKIMSHDNTDELGFVLGKSKLAPTHGHSVPRLELCAAVLAVEIGCSIADHLSLPIEEFNFYSDSKIVLGYIFNTTRRFYTYVTNRVSFIRKITKPEQWKFVSTEKNPADQATRALPAHQLKDSAWLNGPPHLATCTRDQEDVQEFAMVDPDTDKEVRTDVTCFKSNTDTRTLGSHYFLKFGTWKSLLRTFALLRHIAKSIVHRRTDCGGWHYCSESNTVEALQETENFIVKTVQRECYPEEVCCLSQKKPLPPSSSLLTLDVFLDSDGILRVGGRLNKSGMPRQEINPILIPGKHHIGTLLVRHFHDLAKHQGRNITSASIRLAGFWITGCKRLVSSVIYKCVKCRKLRGKFAHQKMADLPPDRLEPGPPFTYIGIDCFGPWEVVTRRTRGGVANSKRWGVLFTCLVCRGVHVEVVEEMTSSSFINAFKRFVAIRGNVKQVRSDRGTNFVGATDSLMIDAVNVEDEPVKNYLRNSGTVWLFNPPHSSHFGGVWERLIGVTRRVLDSMMMDVPKGGLTHEVLTTFMAEACAIVNNRPLAPVSSDPEEPTPLSPSLILTHKPDAAAINVPVEGKELYRSQWKRVQHLSNTFWKRWRTQYLQTLQNFRKWKTEQRNLAVDDVVLLRDHAEVRNYWPMGRVSKVFPSSDNRVRKVEVMVYRDGHYSFFVRPVNELVLLLSEE